jgi:hypothetical protein
MHDLSIFLLVAERFDMLLSFRIRRKFGETAQNLTTSDSADVNVVSQNGYVCCRNRERDLCEGRIEGFNADDRVLLVVKTECVEKSINLNVRVRRPNSDMITMLVSHARSFDIQLYVYAIAVGIVLE